MNPTLNPKRLLVAGAVAGSLVTGIAVGATTLAVSAASSPSPVASPAPASPGQGSGASGAAAPSMPAHGSSEHEGAETPVTGDNAAKAQAAAVKSLGGGTAGAVTTDFTKTGYEVTVTKTDGTQTEVHLDLNFNVMQGHGGPRNGPPPGTNG